MAPGVAAGVAAMLPLIRIMKALPHPRARDHARR
jgi:hypothetical protein